MVGMVDGIQNGPTDISAIDELKYLIDKLTDENGNIDHAQKIRTAYNNLKRVIENPDTDFEQCHKCRKFQDGDNEKNDHFEAKMFKDLPSMMIEKILKNFYDIENVNDNYASALFFWNIGLVCNDFLESVSKILRKTRYMIRLELGDCLIDFDKFFKIILEHPSIQTNIAPVGIETSFSPDYTNQLLDCLTGLKKLELKNCSGINDSNLKEVLDKCRQVEYLGLLKCKHLSDFGMRKIAKSCKCIKILKVQGTDRTTILNVSIRMFGKYFTRLQSLDISGYQISMNIGTLARCKNLQKLKLEMIVHNIKKPISKFYRLLSLDLSWSWDLHDQHIKQIINSCQRIVRLNLSHCSLVCDETLKAIALSCKKLKYIDLSWCKEVMTLGIQQIAISCPDLKEILLTGCRQITDHALNTLGTHCQELQKLEMYACDLITDDGIKYIANCEKLVSLNIGCCNKISDEMVEYIHASCPSLERLCVHECAGLRYYSFLTDKSGTDVVHALNSRKNRKVN